MRKKCWIQVAHGPACSTPVRIQFPWAISAPVWGYAELSPPSKANEGLQALPNHVGIWKELWAQLGTMLKTTFSCKSLPSKMAHRGSLNLVLGLTFAQIHTD